MGGHRRDGTFHAAAAPCLLAVAAVFRRKDFSLRKSIVEAVGPAVVISARNAKQLLRGKLRTLGRVEVRRPILHELIAAVLRRPERAIGRIDGDGDRVANPRCPALPVTLGLARAARVEAPDTGARLELRTRILAG